MLFGGLTGGIELRRAGDGTTRLRGRFPYGAPTTLWDGGRTGRARREVFAPRAFAPRIDGGAEVHLLVGHDFDRPLASRSAGTLDLEDGEEGLAFEARLAPEIGDVPYVRNFLGALEAGLIRGLSPGFRIAPRDGAEEVREEPGGILRTVRAAELYELSAVTVPAYDAAQVEARSWTPGAPPPDRGLMHALKRWRA